MSLLIAVYVLLLTTLVLLRFRKRFNAEYRRQEMLTWPRAKAILQTDHLQLEDAKSQPGGLTKLDRSYQFYTQGRAFHGTRVIPEEITVSREQKAIITKRLNEQRDQLTVRFNPQNPKENVLRVGHQHLSWTNVVAYAFFGVVIPAGLLYLLLTMPK